MSTLNARNTWLKGAVIIPVLGVILAGCSVLDLSETPIGPEPSVEASVVAEPTFSAQSVDPVTVENIYGKHHDPGLNVEWSFVSATSAPYGGVSINLYLKNLNDVPIPPDAIEPVKLKLQDYSGNVTEIEPMDEDSSGVKPGLDLPLGAQAKTTVSYAFNTTIGNLYAAELQIGNMVFKGSLVG